MTIKTGATAALQMRVYVRHYRAGQLLDERDEGTGALTTTLVNALVTSSVTPATNPLSTYTYLGAGTGTTAEADTQTTLTTEVGTRVSLTLSNAQTANGTNHQAILQYLGNWTAAAPNTISEIGVFDASTSGHMADRKLVGPYSLLLGDSLQITYQLLLPSGG